MLEILYCLCATLCLILQGTSGRDGSNGGDGRDGEPGRNGAQGQAGNAGPAVRSSPVDVPRPHASMHVQLRARCLQFCSDARHSQRRILTDGIMVHHDFT